MLLILASMATAADPPGIRAALVPAGKRQSAADFALLDASGKTANLRDYRGKVVLLDFWATWCTGCKEEIPWFSEFQKKYGTKGFAMVGVSLDDGGWKVLKPFLAGSQCALPDVARGRSDSAALWNPEYARHVSDRPERASGGGLHGGTGGQRRRGGEY